jgi:hypothetical protein
MRYTKQEKTDRITAYLRATDILPSGPYRLYGTLLLLEFIQDECDDIMTPKLRSIVAYKAAKVMRSLKRHQPPKAEGVPDDLTERLITVCWRIR